MDISAENVAINANKLIEKGYITEQQKALTMWLFGYIKRFNFSYSEAAGQIGCSKSLISLLFNGEITGKAVSIFEKISSHKALFEERIKIKTSKFVETHIWQEIKQTCDLALIHQMPAKIVGVSQIGKTTALMEYARRSEHRVIYVRMPAAPGFRSTIEAFAEACGVNPNCKSEQLRIRVIKSLDSKTLLLVDELHQLAISAGKTAAMKIMEWIRELHDVSGCGLVVCGTKALDQDLINGDCRRWLEQFDQRCIKRLNLPDRLQDADIKLVATVNDCPDIPQDVMDIIRTLRFNRYIKTILLTKNIANRKNVDFTWRLFLSAHKMLIN